MRDKEEALEQELEFKLPKLGDRTFDASGEFHETATTCLAHSWWGHAVSYKESADVLVTHGLSSTANLDIVILPACFLYRHYLELALKALASDVAEITGDAPPKLDHGLMKRWNFVRDYFLEDEGEGEQLSATEQLLEEWSTIDPNSFSFRYPTSKGGKPSLPDSLVQMNIRQIADAIAKIDTIFTGMEGALDATISAMNDAY